MAGKVTPADVQPYGSTTGQVIKSTGPTTAPVWGTGGGGGSGTVTSVDLALPAELTVSGGPITVSGTLSAVWANESANEVFAGPTTGSPDVPAFRSLVAADIPALSYAADADFVGSGVGHAHGLVPDPGGSAGTTKFLREDATFAAPPGTATFDGLSPMTTIGDIIYFSTTGARLGGETTTTRKFLRSVGVAGVATAPAWDTLQAGDIPAIAESGVTNLTTDLGLKALKATTISTTAPMTGGGDLSTNRTFGVDVFVASGASHASGLVPDPGVTGGTTKFLREDASWQVPPNTPTFALTAGSVAFLDTGGTAITEDNANFFWNKTTHRLGVGTASPSYPIHVLNTGTNAVNTIEAISADALAGTWNFLKGRGTIPTPTVITTADPLGTIMFSGWGGASGYIQGAAIKAISSGTIADTRVPAALSFWVGSDATPSVLTEQVNIGNSGNFNVKNGYYLSAGFAMMIHSANYNIFYEPAGNPGIELGNATDPANYYRNTDHYIQARAGASTFGRWTTAGLKIGSSAAAVSLLHVATDTTAVGIATFEQASADADSFDLIFRKTRGTVASPTVITTADELGTIQFKGYGGASGYVAGAAIKAISSGTIADTRVPGRISLWTGTDAAPTVLTERLFIDRLGNVCVGPAAGTALATSATDGFFHGPSMAGQPSGAATVYGSLVPLVIDTTNAKVMGYWSSGWHNLSPGAGGGTGNNSFTGTEAGIPAA